MRPPVGYFNYRYFVNFLFFVFVGMFYGVLVSMRPFWAIQGDAYWRQINWAREHHTRVVLHTEQYYVPTPPERTAIAFSFMICLSVGLAVFCLLVFHIYLVLTAQTTVEFHGNCANYRRARKRGNKWKNPYDLGWKRNFQQVYGHSQHPVAAVLLPSRREPEFLPLPLPGDEGKRRHKSNNNNNNNKRQRSSHASIV